ncbi:reverse transcriptase protein [Rutstroemia sp. NJR-2017a WRK4]|nr:reverse transcriptase protein [Rutstroemia sp. NJR-2017a WRK4]
MDIQDWSKIDEKEFRIYLVYKLPKTRYPKTKTVLDIYIEEVSRIYRVELGNILYSPKPEGKGDLQSSTPRLLRTSRKSDISFLDIIEKEIYQAITSISPMKAAGPNNIINRAFYIATIQIASHLTKIFNRNRSIVISFDIFRSEVYKTIIGIFQGSLLSPILYLYYNTNLGSLTEETYNRLTETIQKANKWAKRYISVFTPSKFQLTYYIKRC